MNDKTSQTDPFLYDVIDATWPAASKQVIGPVTLREGRGGGSRVSAATVCGTFDASDLTAATEAMQSMGQTPLFMIRDGQQDLDMALAELGFVIKDPVNIRSGSTKALADIVIPRVMTFNIWPPLAVQKEIWAEGGIYTSRLAVMERAEVSKTAIFGRIDDQPAATAFVGVHDGMAMLHALEVRAEHRRKGLAKWMMHHAAQWALRHRAVDFSVVVTQANFAGNALYDRLGLGVIGAYHYRELQSAA